MKCPCCKTELLAWKRLPLETLEEHVMDPNGIPTIKTAYRCPNIKCPTNGEKFTAEPKVFWNEDGELYGDSKGITFIDNNNAPFGTMWRKLNSEKIGFGTYV